MAVWLGTDGVPHWDHKASKETIHEDAVEVVKILRPDWDVTKIKLECKSQGYSNVNYAILRTDGDEVDGIFIRLLNQKVPYFNDNAIKSMLYLRRRKIGAQLLLTFKNGLVMEYLCGDVITWDTYYKIKEPKIWLGVAREIARYHATTNLNDVRELGLPDYKIFAGQFHSQMRDIVKMKNINPRELGFPDADELERLRNEVYESLIEDGAEMCLCHVDSNPTNFVLTKNGPVLVDYDSCFTDVGVMQLAAFLCSVMNITKPDFANLPTLEEEETLIREYLKARADLDPGREAVTDRQVEYYIHLVNKSKLIMNLTAVAAVFIMQEVATKDIDLSLGRMFWDRYQANKGILNKKFNYTSK